MKFIYPLCMLLLLVSCAEEKKEEITIDRTKTDWAAYKLLGNVETVSEKSYETADGKAKGPTRHENMSAHDTDLTFNERGMLILEKQWLEGKPHEETSYNGRDNMLEKTQYIGGSPAIKTQNSRDKAGNVTGIIRRNANNTQLERVQMIYSNKQLAEKKTFNNQDNPTDRITYVYDDKGNLKGENFYLNTEYVQVKNLYEYDKQKRKIAETRYNKDKILYKTIYEYDGKNIVKKETTGPDGKVQSSEKTDYDKKGNILVRYAPDAYDRSETKDEYAYDKNGNMIKWTMTQNSVPQMRVLYKYDDHNNVTATKVSDAKGEVMDDRTYSYEYDEKGNWTKKIIRIKEKPAIITERVFTYFGNNE